MAILSALKINNKFQNLTILNVSVVRTLNVCYSMDNS